ncbi:hypothetical protein V8C34DRAFT_277149 [Trichoderma compactum]
MYVLPQLGVLPPLPLFDIQLPESICLCCRLFSLLPWLPQPPSIELRLHCCRIQEHHCAQRFSYARHGPTYHDFATEGKLRNEAQAKKTSWLAMRTNLGRLTDFFVRFCFF